MLLLIPIILPVISGTILLIKTWKKKPWRRPCFILISALINSAVVLGFLIAQYSESLEAAIVGNVTFRLEPDGLGYILAGCMAVLVPAILCCFLDRKEKVKAQKTEGRRDIFSALLNYLFAAVTGLAFAKNAETMTFFLVLMLLIVAVMVWTGEKPGKWYWIISAVGAAAVIFVLAVAITGGNGAVFYFDGYLSGYISDQGLRILYVLGFCGCSVRALVYPFLAGRKKTDSGESVCSEKIYAENLLLDTIFAFVLIRLTFSVFGISLLRGSWAQVAVTLIAVAGIIAHSVSALREKNLQKKFSYLSAASFALILTGIAVMTSHGYAAAVWMMVGFVSVQMLFIFFRKAVGKKVKSGEEVIAGLGRQMPVTFASYTVACLSICAVPPLAGFLSVWKLAKAFTRQGGLNYLSMAAMFSFLFLAAVNLYPVVIQAFLPKNETAGAEKIDEAGLRMLMPMVVLAAALIALGIFSGPLGDYIYQIGLGLS